MVVIDFTLPGGPPLTPDQFADVCEDAKEGVLEIVNATLVPAITVSGEKVPIVKDRIVSDRDSHSWAAKLQSLRHLEGTGDNEVRKVHAFVVDFGGLDTYQDMTVRHVPYRLRFTIDSYYEDETGITNDNPSIWHSREIAKLAQALYLSRTANRPATVKRVTGFTERRGLARIGETVVRESLAEVYLEIKPVPI